MMEDHWTRPGLDDYHNDEIIGHYDGIIIDGIPLYSNGHYDNYLLV